MITRKAMPLFWAGCLIALCTSSAFAQSRTTGRVAGTVKDQNGAVIVGAEVTLTSLATAEERKVTTDTEGNYIVPLLPPATYRVRVTASRFNSATFDRRMRTPYFHQYNASLQYALGQSTTNPIRAEG